LTRFLVHTSWLTGMTPEDIEKQEVWDHLACCFEDDWHEDDEDERQIAEAFEWLNESGCLYVVSAIQDASGALTPSGSGYFFTMPLYFFVQIPDEASATFFRLRFPTFAIKNPGTEPGESGR
jgi:hypothetical protein